MSFTNEHFYFGTIHYVKTGFYPIVTTYAATFIVGVIGNIAVIRNWAEKRSLRSPTAFLVSLAVADLLMLLLYMPLKMVQYFVITWEKIGTICQLTAYIEILSGTVSVFDLFSSLTRDIKV